MHYFKDLTRVFQLNFDIFNNGFFQIVLNFKLSDKRLIKKKQSHCHEEIAVIVTKVDGFIYFSESSIV